MKELLLQDGTLESVIVSPVEKTTFHYK